MDATFQVLDEDHNSRVFARCVSVAVVRARVAAAALARSSPQILPAAKKSINKCVVSLRGADGMGLSGMSGKAAEHEIEFRTERGGWGVVGGGGGVTVCFAYLFIWRRRSGALLRGGGELNTPDSAGGSLTSSEEVRSAGYSSGGKWGIMGLGCFSVWEKSGIKWVDRGLRGPSSAARLPSLGDERVAAR